MLFGALGVAGVLGITGSAFTAASNFANADDDAIDFGRVEQTVSGFVLRSVDFTYVPDTDTTTEITVVVEDLIDDTAGVLRVEIDGTGLDESDLQACDGAVVTDDDLDGVDDGAADFSTVTCDIADEVIDNSVRYVIEG
jgi:hypothetical protein